MPKRYRPHLLLLLYDYMQYSIILALLLRTTCSSQGSLTFFSFSTISSMLRSPLWHTLFSIWASQSHSSLFLSLKMVQALRRSAISCLRKDTWAQPEYRILKWWQATWNSGSVTWQWQAAVWIIGLQWPYILNNMMLWHTQHAYT